MCDKRRALAYWMILFFTGLQCISANAQVGYGTPSRNDHIFPAAVAARRYIDFDTRGFLINGKRTYITSAGMEYARVPRALWKDRLMKFKRAGFNTVEIYTFWNFHEEKEGQFNFSGDHDLNAYLQLVKRMGMYAIVRVGPYYCGEWNLGGYPVWLKFKPGLKVRENDPQFLRYVDRFFDRLIPIVAKNQINHGGCVIMVQLENEHRAGWGTITPNHYFKHLIAKTTSLGMQVPYFFSGLHSGNDPASDAPNLDDPARPNPWMAIEYWAGWYLNYGPQEGDSIRYDRSTWKMIAHGAGGYNMYMAHGGTNFGYNNDRDMAASYDYGAAVGQAGDLRPSYYSFKRANWFARCFESILANSTDYKYSKPIASDTAIKITGRHSSAGDIIFIDNPDSVARRFKIKTPDDGDLNTVHDLELAAGQITPLIANFKVSANIYLAWSPSYVYNIVRQGKTTTFLMQGKTGSFIEMFFSPGRSRVADLSSYFKQDGTYIRFKSAPVAAASPTEYRFTVGDEQVRIIAVNDELAKRSWFINSGKADDLVIGPEYAGEASLKNGLTTLETARPWLEKSKYPVWIYPVAGRVINIQTKPDDHARDTLVKPSAWVVKNASKAAQPGFDDSKWLKSRNPLQMGADGDITADAWYRAKFKVSAGGDYVLRFGRTSQTDKLQHGAVFLDGKRIDTTEYFADSVNLSLQANKDYKLAVFIAHSGRNKLIFKVGGIDTLDIKGIAGPVTLQKAGGKVISVTEWRMKGGPGDPLEKLGWRPLIPVRTRAPKFYKATLNLPARKNSKTMWRVNTTSLSYGSVWVNGHNLGRYPEKIRIWGLYIPECWLKPGKNDLVIYDENGVDPAGVVIQAETEASRSVSFLQYKTKLLQ